MEDPGKMEIVSRRDRYKGMMETQGVKTIQKRISSHSIMTKIKTPAGNLSSNMSTNPSKEAYFIRGALKFQMILDSGES
jgi:hypothetical protein